jgi:hypothetical protein
MDLRLSTIGDTPFQWPIEHFLDTSNFAEDLNKVKDLSRAPIIRPQSLDAIRAKIKASIGP